jgi:hypothetical protein
MIFELFQSNFFNLIFGFALIVIIGFAIMKIGRVSSDESPMDSFLINFVVGLVFLGTIYWILKNKIIEIPPIGISGSDILAVILFLFIGIGLLVLVYGLVVVIYTLVYEVLLYLKRLLFRK